MAAVHCLTFTRRFASTDAGCEPHKLGQIPFRVGLVGAEIHILLSDLEFGTAPMDRSLQIPFVLPSNSICCMMKFIN